MITFLLITYFSKSDTENRPYFLKAMRHRHILKVVQPNESEIGKFEEKQLRYGIFLDFVDCDIFAPLWGLVIRFKFRDKK